MSQKEKGGVFWCVLTWQGDGHACSCTSLQGNSMCITFRETSLGTSGDRFWELSLKLDSITDLTLQVKATSGNWNQDERKRKLILVGLRSFHRNKGCRTKCLDAPLFLQLCQLPLFEKQRCLIRRPICRLPEKHRKCSSITCKMSFPVMMEIYKITPLSTQDHHSKSVEFEPNSHRFFKIFENLDQISNSYIFVKISKNLAQIPHIFQLMKRCRSVNHEYPFAESGIWLSNTTVKFEIQIFLWCFKAKFQIPLSAEGCFYYYCLNPD